MSNALVHFPVYIGDMLKKFIEHPTLEERGAWLSIMVALIQNDGVLPDDETLFYKCMIFDEKNKQVLKQVLSKCLTKTRVGYVCNDITDLIIKQKQLRDKRVEAGKKGGKVAKKNKQVLEQVPKQMPKQSESESELELEPDSDSDLKVYLSNIPSQFEEFWSAYKNYETLKGSKQKAKEQFIKVIKKGESYERIRSGLDAYIDFTQRTRTKTKAVAGWLKDERWKDEYPTGGANDLPSASGGESDYNRRIREATEEGLRIANEMFNK